MVIRMVIYIIADNDEYELPYGCFQTAGEVARYLGVTENTVRKKLCKGKKEKGRKEFIYKKRYKVIQQDDGVKPNRDEMQRRCVERYDATHDRSGYYRERYRRRKDSQARLLD